MTDINTRGKLPFTVVSSSVNTGYAAQLTSSVGYNIDIVNHHKDEYGGIENSPLQGPFTNQHVGGNQHRHVKLNDGNDNSDNRPEGYIISASVGSVKVYGPDIKGINKPRSLLTRDTTAKSPVNIKNIETSGNIAGNFEHNYQVVQSVGRRTSNNLVNDNFIASGNLTSQFLLSNKIITPASASIGTTGAGFYTVYFTAKIIKNNNLVDSGYGINLSLVYGQPTTNIVESGKNITINSSKTGSGFGQVETASQLVSIINNTSNWVSGVPKITASFVGLSLAGISAFSSLIFSGGSIFYDYSLPNIINNSKSIFVERFSAPGGKEEISRGALDREGEEYAPNNSLTTRNIKVRQPYYNQLTQHSAQFNSGSTYKLLPDTGSVNATTIHGINRNTLQKVSITGSSYFTGSKYDNFWVQHAIPRTDLRYKWIADSVSSSQQPIEYQSYNLPYSTSSLYNSNGAFSDLSFELTGPFGDHLGISGAIDKNEMFVSTYTNTMYRDKKYFEFDETNTYVDLSSVSREISEKDFTISFWMKSVQDVVYNLNEFVSSLSDSFGVGSIDSSPQAIFFKPDGSKLYVLGATNRKVFEFDLPTRWDLSDAPTFITTNTASISPINGSTVNPRGMYIKPDGTKLYITANGGKLIQFTLSTPWSINTTGSAIQYPVSEEFNPTSIFFKPDGTKIYLAGTNTDTLYEKTLSIPWDLTTTSSVVSTLLTAVASPRSVNISKNGKRLIIVDSSPDELKYYTFNEPWNLSSGLVAIEQYSLDLSVYSLLSRGIYINEFGQKLYYVGEDDRRIYQFNIVNQPLPLLQYSGSSSDNNLLLNITPSGSNLYISGTDVKTTIKSLPNINDGDWHLITLVSDLNSRIRRLQSIDRDVAVNTTITKIYVDGGLATQATQLYKKLDISGLFLSSRDKVNLGRSNYNLQDIMLWNSVLTEEQINDVYRISKSSFGKEPKKYLQHKLDNPNIPTPIHIYSTRVEENTTTLLDELGNTNGTLVNFTASVNLQPQNTGLISYSTYFNGPYQGASWKSIRNAEHPITRKLTTENTNIISVVVPEGQLDVYRNINGTQVRFTLPGSKKQGTILNIKESPVYINNKPLKHKFILKDSTDQNVGFELTHTYGNNLQYFANKQLNDTLGLGKKERQIYDTLLDYYNGNTDENENPIERLVGYTYSETVFPKSGQALLKDVRQRTDYITDEPGYGLDGYDRQLGTQRVFWRDNQEDRMRTRNSYINSIGNTFDSIYLDLPFQTPSVAALEFISESKNVEYIKDNNANIKRSFLDTSYYNCSELNQNLNFIESRYVLNPSPSYRFKLASVSQNPEIYFFKGSGDPSRESYNVILNKVEYPDVSTTDPSSLRYCPSFIFEHSCWIVTSSLSNPVLPQSIYNNFTHDLGLTRITELISGKKPWHDSYEDYYVDIKTLSNDNLKAYSKISEFKISDNIDKLIGEYGGDPKKIALNNYEKTENFNYRDLLEQQNSNFCEQNIISIAVSGIKKLLPYNGFYPQDRSIQLINYLKQSYLDTNVMRGGLLLRRSAGDTIIYDDSDPLIEYYRQSSFLEPLYSPGIFYNLIKSGIAVDWSVYTGSLPTQDGGGLFVGLQKTPNYKINFESLLDLKNIPISSSVQSEANRIMKLKEIDSSYSALDYLTGDEYSFQGFFERIGEGSKLYSLSINNFLAETINFFLKDSKLNSFISKPETDFAEFDSTKTYYMNIVLRKKDIVICEAHSSSLAYNFGKMSGRYFGPSFWTGSSGDFDRIQNGLLLAETLRDPAYCAYTPPYYYGDAIARLSFKPNTTGRYTLNEIFQELQIESINTGFIDDTVYTSGSLYSSFVMPVESSVKLKGQIEERQQTIDLASVNNIIGNLTNNILASGIGTATNATNIKKWVISPKMEVPVLDFSNQEFITSSNILTQSYADQQLKALHSYHTPPTASGFGRGMWSGYGEIPTGDKGIFVELRESYPSELIGKYNPATKTFTQTNTASLLQACGFQQVNSELSKKIGELADSREISEAIVIIPYLDNSRDDQNIIYYRGEDPQSLFGNGTVSIEGHNFFTIDRTMFNHQKQNVSSNKPAVDKKFFLDLEGNVVETSISRMIKLMSKYVLPPNFDFLINPDIKPFVMYISEFTSTLDKQDLADIWQGVMPKIATRAEREQQVISHKNSIFDFFHGQGLPKDVKFLIFKAKKRAEINYYKMTADSTDDGLFPSIQAGKPPSPYSFNWPYDYCSLVETARVDVEIEYINKSGSNIT